MARWLMACGTFLLLVGIDRLTFAAAPQDRMNVLLIVSDDLTNNAMSCYQPGIAKTPHLDRLATKGVRFNRAYCQHPLCNPSRASFLTGLRPDTLGVYENATYFRDRKPDVQTLPQSFRKAGYFVARVGKLYHYGVPAQIGTNGLDDAPSWEKVINPKGRDKGDEELIFSITPNAKGAGRFGATLSWLAAEGTDAEQTDGLIAAEVSQLLKTNHDRPFFFACGFFRPHTPYVAPKAYFQQFPTDKITLPKVPVGHREAGPAAAFASAKKVQDELSDELRKQAIQAYLASTTFMDAQVGLVLQALAEAKLAEKTIVVFISDHGYHLGEHGLWQKQSLFENSARVPLLIYDPRAKGNGQVCERTVELVDLHATLAELCGIAAPKTDGMSLKPLLEDPAASWSKPAITQTLRGNPAGKAKGKGAIPFMGYSVRTEAYRYILWDGGEQGEQLYDLKADPNEFKNLAQDPGKATIIAQLKAKLPPRKRFNKE